MKADPGIQQTWSRILGQVSQPGDFLCQKLDEGYYAVAHRLPAWNRMAASGAAADYEILRTLIPHLDRTRAVPLNFRHDFVPTSADALKTWAGELATDIDAGDLHAYAVVDTEAFGESVAWELRTAGWQVERAKEELRVADGQFVQPVNLLRVIVEMVIARSGIAEAQRALREKVAGEFTLYRRLFQRFAERFQGHDPAVLDHYFTAYPDASCVAAGWDYWEVSGRTSSNAEQVFTRAMEEFSTFLTADSDGWLAGLLAGACHGGQRRAERRSAES